MTELKQYYKQIQKTLPCTHTYKKRLIQELKESVDSYLKEHPDTDMRAIENRFGTAEQIVASYAMEMDAVDIVKNHRMRKRIITVAVAVITVALVLWLVALIVASIDAADDERGYLETGIIVEEGSVN